MEDNIVNDNSPKNIIRDNFYEKNNSPNVNAKVTISFSLNKNEPNPNLTLSDLKKNINTYFHMRESDYKLYIGNQLINKLSGSTLVKSLFEKYSVNTIEIKTLKSIIDTQNELNIYENFLDKKITQKENEIQNLNKEKENLINDLKEFS